MYKPDKQAYDCIKKKKKKKKKFISWKKSEKLFLIWF